MTDRHTVSVSTMMASSIERVNAPAKSPVRSCWNRAWNQCSDVPCIGKVEPAGRPLERQDVDRRHRTVQKGNEQREECRQGVERPGALAVGLVARCGLAHRRYPASSLRTSTMRRIPATIRPTVISSITALAAAGGYCTIEI